VKNNPHSSPSTIAPKSPTIPLPPAIILVEPQLGENIGTAARAMANFGLKNLRLVNPRDGWPNEKAQKASANAIEVVNSATVYGSLEEAIADLQIIFATTARPRDMVKEILSPQSAACAIHKQAKQGHSTGILFGCEKSGLTNTDISYADAMVIAPVDPTCASINLAQTVLLIGYEWYKNINKTNLGRKTKFDGPAQEGTLHKETRPATKQELIALFEHLNTELENSGFLRTAEKTPQMMRNIRNMIIKMHPTDQDVRTLRGMIASLVKTSYKTHSKK